MSRLRLIILIVVLTGFVVAIFTVNPQEELQLARQAYSQGDFDQALRHGRRAILFPSDQKKITTSTLNVLSQAALKMDHPMEAESFLDELLALDKTDAYAWLRRGKIKQETGRNQDALQDFEHGFELFSENKPSASLAEYYATRGLAYLELKQPALALEQAEKSLASNSRAPEPHLLLSKIYENREQFSRSLKEAELAWQFTLRKDATFILSPAGEKLSKRLVDLRVKVLRSPEPVNK